MEPKRNSCFAFARICGAHMVKLNDWVFSALENDVICVITATKGDSLVSVSFWLPKTPTRTKAVNTNTSPGMERL